MKKMILALAITLPLSAFSQGNTTTGARKEMAPKQKLGVYVGADYMNLSEAIVTLKTKNGATINGSKTDTNTSGIHMGMAGVRVGYEKLFPINIGFDLATRFIESFNKSEYGDTKLQMIIPEANFVAGVGVFRAYIGANLATFTGSTAARDYKTQVGGQAGLGVRLPSGLGINAGSTLINQKLNLDSANLEDADVLISGFTTNITYSF